MFRKLVNSIKFPDSEDPPAKALVTSRSMESIDVLPRTLEIDEKETSSPVQRYHSITTRRSPPTPRKDITITPDTPNVVPVYSKMQCDVCNHAVNVPKDCIRCGFQTKYMHLYHGDSVAEMTDDLNAVPETRPFHACIGIKMHTILCSQHPIADGVPTEACFTTTNEPPFVRYAFTRPTERGNPTFIGHPYLRQNFAWLTPDGSLCDECVKDLLKRPDFITLPITPTSPRCFSPKD